MLNVLLFGLDDKVDNAAILQTRIAALCRLLCEKRFSIGLEKFPFNTELGDYICSLKNRITQIETLAENTFNITFDDLLLADSAQKGIKEIKAVKPLIPRAKLLHIQLGLLESLLEHPKTPFFGLGDNPDAQTIGDSLTESNISLVALFTNHEAHLIEMRKTFKAMKTPVEAFFLFSAEQDVLTDDRKKTLRDAHITPTNVASFLVPSSLHSFLHTACELLNQQKRLSTSMRAMEKEKQAPTERKCRPVNTEYLSEKSPNENTSNTDTGRRMKQALNDFRNIFGEGSHDLPTHTIVGNRGSSDDE